MEQIAEIGMLIATVAKPKASTSRLRNPTAVPAALITSTPQIASRNIMSKTDLLKPKFKAWISLMGAMAALCVGTPAHADYNMDSAATKSTSPMALNLTGMITYGPYLPTVDMMKKSSNWMTQCDSWVDKGCTNFQAGASSWDTGEEAKLDLDEQGWVRSLPSSTNTSVKYRKATTTLFEGNVNQQVGKYIVLYDGAGTISYSGVATKIAAESKPGRDVVNVTAGAGGMFLSIVATTPGNYLKNIRVIPPGGVCANNRDVYAASASACSGGAGAYIPFEGINNPYKWHPAFLTDLKGFRTLRFMDWAATNTTQLSHWADRPLVTDRTWAGNYGMPLERQFAIAARVGADPWINISPYADDDYVQQFAKLAKAQLPAKATLNLEYANEPWNYGFTATAWMLNQAKAIWAADVAKGANIYTLQTNFYGLRAGQICKMVKAEFGADANRVRCIANTQAANPGWTEQLMQCTYAAKILGAPCSKIFDVVAIAPYFGYYVGDSKYRATISSWYKDADGGLGKMFTELTGYDAAGNQVTAPLSAVGSGLPRGAISQTQTWISANKAVADKYGLPLWAYEGGQHLVVFGGDNDPNFLNLLYAANRDPRMGQAYNQMLNVWKSSGGQTYALFAHSSLYSRWGMWGLKEGQFMTAPKWQMATKWRDSVSCWWAGCTD